MVNSINRYKNTILTRDPSRSTSQIFPTFTRTPAIVDPAAISGPLTAGDIHFQPFEQDHGFGARTLGFRFGDAAYSNDVVKLPEAAFDVLQGVKLWIVDAIRYKPHPTHSHLDQTLTWISRVKPERAILTNMHIDLDYQRLRRELPPGVEPAYDGMVTEPDSVESAFAYNVAEARLSLFAESADTFS
jgi:phosphoribosyl 1,2-cyclic phosphate phosphodiesterase